MSTWIHPTAVIEKGAELDADVRVGAYAYIGPHVSIQKGSEIMHHATVDGATQLGAHNEVHPYAYVGGKTHDLKYAGGIQRLRIGSHNVFREFTTIHCATNEASETVLGDHNLILSYSHVAHECQVGNHLIMSSHAALGGHVEIGDHVNVGWGAGLHQFCRVGDHAMVGAASKIVQDIPPYMIADGNPGTVRTINKVGLERAGYDSDAIAVVRRLFKTFFKAGLNRSQAIAKFEADSSPAERQIVERFIQFVQSSDRGLA
jgi:UDP-N-acetylglucosamine acyltransferase